MLQMVMIARGGVLIFDRLCFYRTWYRSGDERARVVPEAPKPSPWAARPCPFNCGDYGRKVVIDL